MKYQCNSCGVVYEYRSDAVNCHPDINEIPDEELESHLAAEQSVHPTRLTAAQKEEVRQMIQSALDTGSA